MNRAMLKEKDSPMLKRRSQEIDQHLIRFPIKTADQPDCDRLNQHYSEFLNAT